MGFFDKLKTAVGGHGVSVEMLELKEENINSSSKRSLEGTLFTDSYQIFATARVHAKKPVDILNHKISLIAEWKNEDITEKKILSQEIFDQECYEENFPYKLNADQSIDIPFSFIIDGGLELLKEELDLSFEEMINNDFITFKLQLIADVKGTLLDAKCYEDISFKDANERPIDLSKAVRFSENSLQAFNEKRSPSEALKEIAVRNAENLPLEDGSYLQRFEKMIEELEAHPDIDDVSSNILAADINKLNTLKKTYADLGIELEDAFYSFYEECNGIEISWESEKYDACGSILIGGCEVEYYDADMFGDDTASHKTYIYVDYIFDGSEELAYFDIANNSMGFYTDCEKSDLKLSFAGYLEVLLKSRGFSGVQSAINYDLIGGREYTSGPSIFRATMPKLFKDYQHSFFFTRDNTDRDSFALEQRNKNLLKIIPFLEAENVKFSLKDEVGEGITMIVEDNTDNFSALAEATEKAGLGKVNLEGLASKSIGSFAFRVKY